MLVLGDLINGRARMKKLVLLIILLNVRAIAQWTADGVAICDTSANASSDPLSQITSDGNGGAYICWRDLRVGNGYNVYAQHIDRSGKQTWQNNGIPITTLSANENYPRICSDGFGGAYVAWEDDRLSNTFVYAQRIDAEGGLRWAANGIKVAETPGIFISMCSDGNGGLLIGWTPLTSVFVQRLDSLGNRCWGDSGVKVTNRPGTIWNGDVHVASDGTGGGFVIWSQGTYPVFRVFVQKFSNKGAILWPNNGILLSDTTYSAGTVFVAGDGKGGAIATWGSYDSTGRVQRVSSSGQILWTPKGVAIPGTYGGGNGRITSDSMGGAFVGYRAATNHLDSLGNKLWGDTGSMISDITSLTNLVQVPDGQQGVWVFGELYPNNTGGFIYCQHTDRFGNRTLGNEGLPMTPGLTGNLPQEWPDATTDDSGGAIVCWTDYRKSYGAIYAARVDSGGIVTYTPNLGMLVPPSPTLEQNFPNPFNPTTTIQYGLPTRSQVSLRIYNILGQRVVDLVNAEQAAGYQSVVWNANVASGIYFYRIEAVSLADPGKRFVDVKKMVLVR